jgi:hypothetical protein
VIVLGLKIPQQSHDKDRSIWFRIRELDLIGAFIIIPAVVCLLLALHWGGSTYSWKNSRIIGLFIGYFCLTSVFIFTQIRLGDRATLPPSILSQRTVVASCVYSVLFGAAFFVLVYYLPVYFQSIKGASATRSGIDILPLLISIVLSSIACGGLITLFGYYTPFVIFGTTLSAIGSGLISTFSVDTPFPKQFGYQVLTGAGVGFGFQIPIIAVQTVLPLANIPIGTAAVIFFQTLGGALFVSVGQTLFQNGVIRGMRQYVPGLNPEILLRAGATELRVVLKQLGLLNELPAVLKAYMVGLTDSYRATVACISAAAISAWFFEWKSIKDEEVLRKKKAGAEMGIT